MNKRAKDGTRDDRGAAMITAIFAMIIATAMMTAVYYSANSAMAVSTNDRDNTEATYVAEAGITHAVELINKVQRSNYSAILTSGDGTANTGDELTAPPVTGAWTTAQALPAGSSASGGVTNFGAGGNGRYWVTVRNDTAAGETATADGNGILIVTSTGVGRDGSTATLEATIRNNNGPAIPAFLADGNTGITNLFTVSGPNGIVYINGNLSDTQDVCAEIRINVGGTVSNISRTKIGAPCTTTGVLGSTVFQSQPRILPPIYDIPALRSNFRPKADYVFKPTGIYHQVNGVQDASPLTAAQITAASLGGFTWSASAVQWAYSSASRIPDGTYYFENCNAKVTNGGSSTGGLLSMFAEGSISMTNYPAFVPDTAYPGYSLVSANDIQISGTLGTSANPALLYAYGQINFTNQSTILGGVVAANYCLADGTNGPDIDDMKAGQNLVSRASDGTVRFSNKVQITSVNNFMSGPGGASIVNWREVRQ